MDNFGGALGNALAVVGVLVVVLVILFLLFREFVCWYWKTNETIGLLTEIRDLLAANEARSAPVVLRSAPAAAVPKPRTKTEAAVGSTPPGVDMRPEIDDTRWPQGALDAARVMARAGYSIEEIAKRLRDDTGLSESDAADLALVVKSEPATKK